MPGNTVNTQESGAHSPFFSSDFWNQTFSETNIGNKVNLMSRVHFYTQASAYAPRLGSSSHGKP